MPTRAVRAAFVVATVLGCGSREDLTFPNDEAVVAAVLVAQGLEAPLFLTSPPGDERLFVVEQPGRIRIVDGGALLPVPFLDIADRVGSGGERGLLGLAFHPDYAANGRLFVDYTDLSGGTRVSRFQVTADPDVADPASETVVLEVAQPFANHNGGMLAFGPDGMLYVGLGDGGSGGDPFGHGQNVATLLGSILRVDVDGAGTYAVPPDNPLIGRLGARDEIWAFGVRNPWRFSFDGATGALFVADVGQNRVEEVSVLPAGQGGANLGWSVMEGTECFQEPSCDRNGLTLPLLEYGHDEGCSITGGYVYRGARLPDLGGHYFFADYCEGWIRSARIGDGPPTEPAVEWSFGDLGRILSFGEDADGELYILSDDGRVHRIEPTAG